MSDNNLIDNWLTKKDAFIADLSKPEKHTKFQFTINQLTSILERNASVFPKIHKDYLTTMKLDLEAAKATLITQGKWTLN